MTSKEFKEKWILTDNDLHLFTKASVDNLDIAESEKEFLYLSGLPSNCAPFIGFGDSGNPKLEKLADVWDLDSSFVNLFIIGSDGSGDPICVENRSGKILTFNHDEDFEEIFMNSSLHQLAEFLLLTREGISMIRAKYDSDAIWDESRATEIKKVYRDKFAKVDANAIGDGKFWDCIFEVAE